jgi:hypothetical protein
MAIVSSVDFNCRPPRSFPRIIIAVDDEDEDEDAELAGLQAMH